MPNLTQHFVSIARRGRQLARAVAGPNEKTRYEARYGLLRRLAKRYGFELYNANLSWMVDNEFWAIWERFPNRQNYIVDRKFVVYYLAKSVAVLAGDTAECGVFEGASSYLICKATGDRKKFIHHIFDSFEGLSEPKSDDIPPTDHTYRWAKHDLAVPLEKVQQNLTGFDNIQYHRGWIPERFDDVSHKTFSFVHVDVDLFQPTRDALHFFYERLAPGGVLLCDDYGSLACPGAKKAFDELTAAKPEGSVVHLPTGQGFITKR